jgi:carlactone synthase/all-trans-10'-apo-beta-carotenal 13,14-cleaving dioxygenase
MFVAKPGATAEDDGVVLTPGVDAEGRTFVVALDGASFKELGRATFPFGTPYRFHGIWLEGDE